MALGELVVKDPSNDRWLAVADAKALKIPPDAIEAKSSSATWAARGSGGR
ncbi:MAG: hypothetical protein IKO55_01240 [Kiritimatiellae bacterium]|nr:hypothetical protein [Kiritimatiellia bacterium]